MSVKNKRTDQEQKSLNNKGFQEEVIISPSGYHNDRALNIIFGIDDIVILEKVGNTVGIIPPTVDFKKLALQFQPEAKSPAGGWYLVKEQRDWLKRLLVQEFRKIGKRQNHIRILEAGVASFLHHFSYLSIVKNALEESNADLQIDIIVVDSAYFPLLCIEEINASTIKRISSDKYFDIYNHRVPVDESFIKFVNKNELLTDNRIKVSTKRYNLIDHDRVEELGKFDIVTEHFITSVIDTFEIIERIRKTYSLVLNNEGVLLCACGITPHVSPSRYDDFMDMNIKNGLEFISRQFSWDPYGMITSNLMTLLEDKQVATGFDNSMFKFQKN